MTRNLASDASGGEITAVTCFDPSHPKENMIDGDSSTFWVTTGLFPQEVVLKLGGDSQVTSIETVTTNAQVIEVRYTDTVTATEWEDLCVLDLTERSGELQYGSEDAPDGGVRATFLKFTIRNGWDDFVTVHKLGVSGEPLD